MFRLYHSESVVDVHHKDPFREVAVVGLEEITDQIKIFLTCNCPIISLLQYICMDKIHTNLANTFFICIAWSCIKSVGIEVKGARSKVTMWRAVVSLLGSG